MEKKIREVFQVTNHVDEYNLTRLVVSCEIDYLQNKYSITPYAGNNKVFDFTNLNRVGERTSNICDLIKEADLIARTKLAEVRIEKNCPS